MNKDIILDAFRSAMGAMGNLAVYIVQGEWFMVAICAGHVAEEMETIATEVAK